MKQYQCSTKRAGNNQSYLTSKTLYMPINMAKHIYPLFRPWALAALAASLAVSVPLLSVAFGILDPGGEAWSYITGSLLAGYSADTALLASGVAASVYIVGLSCAWLVSAYDFPGRAAAQWALVLPIAAPAYILGFAWVGMLDYASPLYVFLRASTGIETGQFLFFDIMSMPGAVFIFSLALYPYVYLLARAWFAGQPGSWAEAGRSMGLGHLGIFFRLAVPLSRPAAVAGVSLAAMEVLNDYGLCSYLGIETFTTGIFTAWFSLGSPASALKLSGIMLLFVFVLLYAENKQRGRRAYGHQYGGASRLRRHKLRGIYAAAACAWVFAPVFLGFALPVLSLAHSGLQAGSHAWGHNFRELFAASFILAAVSAAAICLLAAAVCFAQRLYKAAAVKYAAKFSTLGYAVPGAVVAVGVLVPFLWISGAAGYASGGAIDIASAMALPLLVFAYTVRFMAVGHNSIESSFAKLPASIDESASALGSPPGRLLRSILLPLSKPGLAAAFLLVFIDTLKELPLTLILRPFNFDTLATKTYEYASDERLAEASPPALVIIAAGLAAAALMERQLRGGKKAA
jgi:iron(III) transport system permease protein